MLNCKQGDRAVIVRSSCGNEGKVLTCLRLATLAEMLAEYFVMCDWLGAVWKTDAHIEDTWGCTTSLYPDARLRPLRDSDGEDEMLRLVGRPVGTPQAA